MRGIGEPQRPSNSIRVVRFATEDDALGAAKCSYFDVSIPYESGAEEIRAIFASEYSVGIVVVEGGKIIGFMSGTLLSRESSELLIASKQPYVHRKVARHPRPFPDEIEVGDANVEGGLDLLLAHFSWAPHLAPFDVHDIIELLVRKFVDHFSGYRVR